MSVAGRFVFLSLAGSFVGLFVHSMGRSFVFLGRGRRPFTRLCLLGRGKVRSFVSSFSGSFVLSSVLLCGGSFVP